jgi:putative hydrolase of the HAD superfamily
MTARAFDLIAFDGDDTLWHNERTYRDGRDRFRQILGAAGVGLPDQTIDACVDRIEVANIQYFGYGISSFALSLLEAAIELTDGHITGRQLHQLVELAREMTLAEVELFPGVGETLAALAATHPLMLITKGDLLHQTGKLERSGLQPFFAHVEVVSHKTAAVYERILSRHRVAARRFLMVGNSLRSDIVPVLALGAWAVHVPAALGWDHEMCESPPPGTAQFFVRPALSEVVQLVARIEAGGGDSLQRGHAADPK